MYRLPYGQHAPPEWYICCNQWTYTDKLDHPKSIVYIRVHSCCSTFYRFGRMCNGLVSTIVVSQSSFIALKNPLCSACLSSSQPPHTLLITDPLTRCIVSSFFSPLSPNTPIIWGHPGSTWPLRKPATRSLGTAWNHNSPGYITCTKTGAAIQWHLGNQRELVIVICRQDSQACGPGESPSDGSFLVAFIFSSNEKPHLFPSVAGTKQQQKKLSNHYYCFPH